MEQHEVRPRRRGRPPGWLTRLGLWLAITVVVLRPTPRSVSSTVVSDLGDPMFLTWTLSWGAHSLTADPVGVFDANIFHPHDSMLAFSDPMLSVAPVYGLLDAVTGNRIAALNLTMLAFYVLGLVAAHALGRRILGRSELGVIVALVFATNSFIVGQQNHPQIQTFGLVALGFLALLHAIEHRRARDGLLLGLAAVAIGLSNLTYFVAFVVAGAAAVGALGVQGSLSRPRGLVRPGLAAALPVLAVMGPIALIYRRVGSAHELVRPLEPQHSLLWRDPITPRRGNWLWGTKLDDINSVGLPGEHAAFPGVVALALGVVGVVLLAGLARRLRRARPVPGVPVAALRPRGDTRTDELFAMSVAGVVALAIAIGPSPGGLYGPFRFLHDHIPGFDGIRATSRFSVVVFLVAGLIVAYAVGRFQSRLGGAARMLVVPVVAALILVENVGPTGRVEVPEGHRLAVYEALAERPDGVVIELPMWSRSDGTVWAFVEAVRMYHATTDFNPRVNGYSGHVPLGHEQDSDLFRDFPSAATALRIDELDIRYVVLHTGIEQGTAAYDPATAEAIATTLEAQGWTISHHGEDWLLEVPSEPS